MEDGGKCQGLNTEKSKIISCALFTIAVPPPQLPPPRQAPSAPARHTFPQGYRVGIRLPIYPGEIRPLRDLPPNHAVSVLVAPSFKCAVWMAIEYMWVRSPSPTTARVIPSQSWNSLLLFTVIVWNIRRKFTLPNFFFSISSTATTLAIVPSGIRNMRSARNVLSVIVRNRLLLPPSSADRTKSISQCVNADAKMQETAEEKMKDCGGGGEKR